MCPQGLANFHRYRHVARPHLCSWKPLQEFYQTEILMLISDSTSQEKETERNRDGGLWGGGGERGWRNLEREMRGKEDG